MSERPFVRLLREASAFLATLADRVEAAANARAVRNSSARAARPGGLGRFLVPAQELLGRPGAGSLLLFGVAVFIYAVTRFTALARFPIYFFADEAIQGVLAKQLLERGWRDAQGQFFPVIFNAYGFFNPLISVDVHAVAILLFGRSVEIMRATSALVTLLGTAAVGLSLKMVFRARYWWSGVLLLAATPAWFLHSRTAFETSMTTSFYAGSLFFYLLYRCRSPRFLYPALLLAAATFYSYGNGQIIIGVLGVLLLVSDLPYHLRNWRTVAGGLALAALLSLPYVRFRVTHPKEVAFHLRTLDSYLFKPIPFGEKVKQFARRYGYGLSPRFWFFPNERELVRHRMKGYAQIPLWSLPLLLVGITVCLARSRSPAHRAVILAALATPVGGALTEIGITRVLAFVIPAALLSALGLQFLIERVRRRIPQLTVAGMVFLLLSFPSLGMLRDALRNGALWYRDYGLYGMQWGARQIFDVVSEYIHRSPTTQVCLTPTWANGTDVFLSFFLPNEPRVRFQNVDSFLAEKRPLDANMVIQMTPEELGRARKSGKFRSIRVERTLRYPDGTDGFYFVRLAYTDSVDKIFALEEAERRKPETGEVTLDGEKVPVTHSRLDAGTLANLFDRDTFTMVRGMQDNPVFLEFRFPSGRAVRGIAADFGSMNFALTASLWVDESRPPTTYTRTFKGLPPDPHVEMDFAGAPERVRKLRIEVLNLDAGTKANIHIREVRFR